MKVFVCCVCLSRETKRLNDLPKLTQEAMLPEMKFRIPDTQGAVDSGLLILTAWNLKVND